MNTTIESLIRNVKIMSAGMNGKVNIQLPLQSVQTKPKSVIKGVIVITQICSGVNLYLGVNFCQTDIQ